MESECIQSIIIDTGGDTVKAGFHKDSHPHTVFPNLVGRLKRPGFGLRDFVGYEAETLEEENLSFSQKCPIEDGLIKNWDDIEVVWHHTFYDNLRIEPEEHPVLLIEPPLCPKSHKENKTQIMFETFNTPALYLCSSTRLSIYGAGRITGTVVETGHTSSVTAPVWQGYELPSHSITPLDISGNLLTRYLAWLLSDDSHCFFDTRSDLDRIRNMKETRSYVALNYQHDVEMGLNSDGLKSSYKLPDGKEIHFENELFTCPEILFQPTLCSVYTQPSSVSLQESVCSSVSKCDKYTHKLLYDNIVLSGGSSLFPGLKERLEWEVSLLSPYHKVRVIAPAERKHLAWIGGAHLASLSTFNQVWYTKQEYDESGPSIVIRNVF